MLTGAEAPVCERLEASEERDQCLSERALDAARSDPDEAMRTLKQIESALIRDYGFLNITREKDPGNPRWCREIQNAQLKERCDMLIRRPHLHRPLAGDPPKSSE